MHYSFEFLFLNLSYSQVPELNHLVFKHYSKTLFKKLIFCGNDCIIEDSEENEIMIKIENRTKRNIVFIIIVD